MLRDFERADRIGEFWRCPASRPSPSFLIEWEDRIQGAVLVGMLTEDRGATSRVAASSYW